MLTEVQLIIIIGGALFITAVFTFLLSCRHRRCSRKHIHKEKLVSEKSLSAGQWPVVVVDDSFYGSKMNNKNDINLSTVSSTSSLSSDDKVQYWMHLTLPSYWQQNESKSNYKPNIVDDTTSYNTSIYSSMYSISNALPKNLVLDHNNVGMTTKLTNDHASVHKVSKVTTSTATDLRGTSASATDTSDKASTHSSIGANNTDSINKPDDRPKHIEPKLLNSAEQKSDYKKTMEKDNTSTVILTSSRKT